MCAAVATAAAAAATAAVHPKCIFHSINKTKLWPKRYCTCHAALCALSHRCFVCMCFSFASCELWKCVGISYGVGAQCEPNTKTARNVCVRMARCMRLYQNSSKVFRTLCHRRRRRFRSLTHTFLFIVSHSNLNYNWIFCANGKESRCALYLSHFTQPLGSWHKSSLNTAADILRALKCKWTKCCRIYVSRESLRLHIIICYLFCRFPFARTRFLRFFQCRRIASFFPYGYACVCVRARVSVGLNEFYRSYSTSSIILCMP